MRRLFLIAIGISLLVGCASQKGAVGETFPNKTIEIIAPASPGGGWDMAARSSQRALKADGTAGEDITVINKPGGGGEVGWQYLNQQDGHFAALNSSLLITGQLLGQSELTYEQFTPLAMLSTEWLAVATKADAGFENATELMDQLREDPKSLTIGVSPSLGSGNHLAFVQAAIESGIDPTELQFLVYSSGGDIMNALLGGHIDLTSNSMSDLSEQYEAGEVEILAITSPERLDSFPDIPTWQEQGVSVEFPHWRGIMGPPDMSETEIAQWDDMLSEMVETEEWKTDLDNNDLDAFYMNSNETVDFLKEQHEFFKDIVSESGLAP
ncbi:tripartite-type tricarboxylate transporter receptor subunit TctC [Virgibacillus halotolerans]|uniref:tripartite tricarboxylate transporter substrate binding protein n=1 Tax=Virgibacillus halotolerans TaxID=1071053 RepID=UPI00195FB10F|nr:tripartite tricarboxylate transporter substrate-binding protein [Virgibacillus halotolerans]MBM7599318.1 tripartite-type tricarboxylate transporter receptor subunit TctC [Virgibacillus halotolerans]